MLKSAKLYLICFTYDPQIHRTLATVDIYYLFAHKDSSFVLGQRDS